MRVILPLPKQKNSPSSSSPSSSPTESEREVDESSALEENLGSEGNKFSFPTEKSKLEQPGSTNQGFLEKKKPAAIINRSTLASSSSVNSKYNLSFEEQVSKQKSNFSTYSVDETKVSSTSFSSFSAPRKRKFNTCSTAEKNNIQVESNSAQLSSSVVKKHEKMTQETGKQPSFESDLPGRENLGCSNKKKVVVPKWHQNSFQEQQKQDDGRNNPALYQDSDNPGYNMEQSSKINVQVVQRNCKQNQLEEIEDNRSHENSIYETFQMLLKKNKLEMVEQEGDGNCLFRAVSLQIYGESGMHGEIRRKCLDFMAKEKEHFSQFIIDEPFEDYIQRKRIDGVHGNNPEIQAISELFNRPVEVFVPENGAKPINIFHAEYKTSDMPIRLSYHDGNHYNAVIDPLCPTAGLGLGLPGLKPGLADRMQLQTAVKENLEIHENFELEKVREESLNFQMKMAMMESAKYDPNQLYKQKAIALSDVEATDFELEQMVLANSLKSYQTSGKGQKSSAATKRRAKNNSSHSSNSFASTPFASRADASSNISNYSRQAYSPIPPPAAATSIYSANESQATSTREEEYPQTVQELVMNGFELSKVLHAYDLIGNNFDDLLGFLMNSGR